MNRIEERMKALQERNEKALITYITAGLPDLEKTKEIIKAQERAGIDVIELGIPFSDPVADGPVIQDASFRAIQNGTNLRKVFVMMEELRKECNTPIVFMMYYNTVQFYGLDAFVEKCIETGVDGVIVPDLPYEEQAPLKAALEKENAPLLIQLLSPVSKGRIPMVLENTRGFVYCVSQMGVTGKDADFHKNIREYLADVKAVSKVPVMLGFGIKTAEDVKPYEDLIDGAIVGTQFIRVLEANDFDTSKAYEYVNTFKKEMNC